MNLGPSMTETRSYHKKEIIPVKVVAVIVLIPIVYAFIYYNILLYSNFLASVAVAIGFVANAKISDSVETITDSLVESGDSILFLNYIK